MKERIMKISTTVLLVGGLALAGTAMGHEPVAQDTGASGASMKMAIDAKTGKMRAPTAAESAALDAQVKANRNAAKARAKDGTGFYLPQTQAEAEAGMMERGGIITMQPTSDSMSALEVVIAADGSLSYSEHGAPVQLKQVQPQQREVASE
jgi:hypothetical protein